MTLAARIAGLDHIGIRVHDLARSRHFYERLGFDFIAGPIGPEPVAILRHRSGLEINLIINAAEADAANPLMDGPEKHPGYTHIALTIEDIAAIRTALDADGIAVSGYRGPSEAEAMALFIRDPDRNVIELALPAR